jgi:hypothetical protein
MQRHFYVVIYPQVLLGKFCMLIQVIPLWVCRGSATVWFL